MTSEIITTIETANKNITTMEIINKQINQLENEKLFKDIEHKNRNCQYARKFYYNNREKIIKEKTEYSKHYS